MKSILFLSSWYPSRVHTSLGNFVSYHANAVALLNKVNVLYIVPDDNINDYEISYSENNNVATTIVYFKRKTFKYLNYWSAFKKGISFLFQEKNISIDVIHMNIMHPAIWQPLYLNWKYKIPFIVSENWHGLQDLSRYNIGFLKTYLLKLGFKRAYKLCPVSHQLKDAMVKAGFKSDYKVVPNVVDTDLFEIKKKPEMTDSFTFLHVSTLDDKIKNVSGIIDAFHRLNDSTCKLRIIGDGETDWLIEKINSLNLQGVVSVEGEKTYEEISKAMQIAHAFVLFSNIENLPLVLIESLSTGTPFIATKVGGIPEIFDHEMGILLEKNDIEALINAMKNIKQNYGDYKQANIRNYALKYFSYKEVGEQFDQIYDSAVGNSNK